MNEPKEITIRIKGEDKSASFKHLVYEEMHCSQEDVILAQLLSQAKNEFVCEIESIRVSIVMEVE